jgi:hypothetical protein
MKQKNEKRAYTAPLVEKIEIDRQISLAMASGVSEPDGDPEEFGNYKLNRSAANQPELC